MERESKAADFEEKTLVEYFCYKSASFGNILHIFTFSISNDSSIQYRAVQVLSSLRSI
jgi:hypothetical protein